MSQTRIFISSTYFDLKQLRTDLSDAIEGIGHIPIMSEFSAFPVDPSISNIENCRQNVREHSDIFVLIIGGKRGSVDKGSGKSIVNLEYEAAVQQQLDIFIFIEEAVLQVLPIWQKNPAVDLDPVVDSPDILSFIDQIQKAQRWTYSFRVASDISKQLKIQLSNHYRDLLAKKKLGVLDIFAKFKNESSAAKEIVLERAPFWEFLLTAELLDSRFKVFRGKIGDIKKGLVLGGHREMKGQDYLNWTQVKFPELVSAVMAMKVLAERDIQAAWGPPGVSGNPILILEAAEKFSEISKSLLELESDIYRTHPPESFSKVKDALQGVSEELIRDMEPLPVKLREIVEMARNHKGEAPLAAKLDLKFDYFGGDKLMEALSHAKKHAKRDDW